LFSSFTVEIKVIKCRDFSSKNKIRRKLVNNTTFKFMYREDGLSELMYNLILYNKTLQILLTSKFKLNST